MAREILEIIYGPMFAGKSTELVKRIRLSAVAEVPSLVFKPIVDNRYEANKICTHDKHEIDVEIIDQTSEILKSIKIDTKRVFFDELQFFDNDVVEIIDEILDRNIKVVGAGLALDFKGEAFGPMKELMVMAQKITSLSAICTQVMGDKLCGENAYFTQRFIGDKIASVDSGQIMVGEKDFYAPRCGKHWIRPTQALQSALR